MFFEYDNNLWENIQSDLLMGIDREVPGTLIEIISHPAAYELHYQDPFGNLYDYTILKSEVFFGIFDLDTSKNLSKSKNFISSSFFLSISS